MEDQIAKAIELLRNSIEKLGEQGVRLYPELIRLYVFSKVTDAVLTLIALVVSLLITRASIKGLHNAGRETDGELLFSISSICFTVLSFILGIGSYMSLYAAARALYAPEAAFLLSLIGK